jgi:hypothetical protein|tara:strand:+ start:74 stop:730 length:657 start_codon:yes stop_codon:yes gene_type:complete
MNKIITNELIAQRMESKGWIEGCDDEHARNQVLAHFDCEIKEQWNNSDFSIYEESTADGYSVWIATHDDKNININEDVYYYENDLEDVLYEAMKFYSNIYCDNYDLIDNAITRHYNDLLCRIEDEIINELIDEGYTHKIVTPINPLQYIEMISQDLLESEFIDITVDHAYKWLNNATQIIKDKSRYEIVANHYGLTIVTASLSCTIQTIRFKKLKNEN